MGDYTTAVVVRDAAGAELDRKWVSFQVGNPQGEITGFRVEPQCFHVGDTIGIALEFKNTGSTVLSGSCVVRIMKAGEVEEELARELTGLAPGAAKTFRLSWSTAHAQKAAVYQAVGFVRYEGTACEFRSAMFSTNLMPVASFVVTPESTKVRQKVGFDASASTDKDGSIARYSWEFGDGGEAEGRVATHAYYEPGDYLIRLSVEDNEMGTAEATKTVTVRE